MKTKSKVDVDSILRSVNVLRRHLDVPRFINSLMTSSLYLCRYDLAFLV